MASSRIPYIPTIVPNNWDSVMRFSRDVQKYLSSLANSDTPLYSSEFILSSSTASRLLATDASQEVVSTSLASWVTGTANQITVTDDTDGTITLSAPQDIHTGASPTFAGLTVDAGSSPGVLATFKSTGETANSTVLFQAERYLTAYLESYRTTASYASFALRRARGTIAAPASVADTDEVGVVLFQGHDGTDWENCAAIVAKADGAVSENDVPTKLDFYTRTLGNANYSLTMALRADRYPQFPIMTVAGFVKNDVDGILSGGNSLVAGDIDLVSWVAGTANRITVADDGDGTITLSTPQNLHTETDFEVQSLLVDQNTNAVGLNVDSEATTLTNYGLQVVTGQGAIAARIAYGDANNGEFLAGLPNNSSYVGNFAFYRNLTAASTDNAIVYIHNDHADDDQPCLELQQDGSGPALLISGGGTMEITGGVIISDDITIPDAGWIGSTTTPESIQIEADGDVVLIGAIDVPSDIVCGGHVIFDLDNGHIGYLDNSPILTFNNADDRVEVIGDLNIANLTTSKLVASDANKNLVSSDLVNWVTGTANRVTVADDGDGTITLSAPQDIHTGASPTFESLTLTKALNPILKLQSNSSSATESGEIQFCSLDSEAVPRIRIVNDESGECLRIDVRRVAADAWTSSLCIFRGTVGQEGRVGIKVAAPQENLHVADTIRADTAFNLNGTDVITANSFLLYGPGTLGDGGSTNYAAVAADGEITLHGTARAWKSWDVRPEAIKLPGANPPAVDNIDGFSFLRFDRGTEESVYYTWEVPNDFATGNGSVKGRFEFVVFNPPTSGGTNVAEVVRMGFEYKKISDGAVFDFTADTTSGYIDETIAVDEAAEIIHHTSDGVCDTTGWAVGDTILFRFYRDATAVEDTYDNEASAADNDVWVFDFHMNYLVDKLGEAT